jgi:hypothetical protein
LDVTGCPAALLRVAYVGIHLGLDEVESAILYPPPSRRYSHPVHPEKQQFPPLGSNSKYLSANLPNNLTICFGSRMGGCGSDEDDDVEGSGSDAAAGAANKEGASDVVDESSTSGAVDADSGAPYLLAAKDIGDVGFRVAAN